jgi:hypothetical protein
MVQSHKKQGPPVWHKTPPRAAGSPASRRAVFATQIVFLEIIIPAIALF